DPEPVRGQHGPGPGAERRVVIHNHDPVHLTPTIRYKHSQAHQCQHLARPGTAPCWHLPGSRARPDVRGHQLPVASKAVLVGGEGTIMAATIEVPVSRPAGLRHRRFPAPIAVGAALVLAVAAAVMLIAVWRGLAPAPAGHRTGTPIVVPHP